MTRYWSYSHGGRRRRFGAIVTSACLVGGAAIGSIATSVGSAGADAVGPITFDSGYANGSVNGQDGWTSTGSYDQAIVDNSTIPGAPASFGTKSLRISDAVTSGSFGDQTFSKSVVNAAGEPGADTGGFPTGTLKSVFSASFNIASTTPSAEQPGLHMSISPDRGDGARMSYIRIEDSPTGFNIFFDDYKDVAPLGSGGNLDDGCGNPAGGQPLGGDDFYETQVASGVSRTAHNIRFLMQLVPGPHNDVVQVLLDGQVIATGTSWEDYYRYCAESGGGTGGPLADLSRITRNLEFRESGASDPANAGAGFLIDGVNLATANPPSTPDPISAWPVSRGVIVGWTPPASNGGSALTGYVVTPYIGGVALPAQAFNSTRTTETVTGLRNGTRYTFKVAATNGVITGPQSAVTGPIVAGAPGVPGKPRVTKAAQGVLKVTFSASANNGSAVTSYTATCTSANGGVTKRKSKAARADGVPSPIGVAGLDAGKTYTCRVSATNGRGAGPGSKPSNAVTA